jgi:hypothetical protein
MQELPPNQLNNSEPEYCVIDGNHHTNTTHTLFPQQTFHGAVTLLMYDHILIILMLFCPLTPPSVCVLITRTNNNIKLLVWGRNYMHDKAVVHKDKWEEVYKNQLSNKEFWRRGKKEMIDWDKYLIAKLVFTVCIHSLLNFTNSNLCSAKSDSKFNSQKAFVLLKARVPMLWCLQLGQKHKNWSSTEKGNLAQGSQACLL